MSIFLRSLPGSLDPEEKGIPLLIAREKKRGWKATPEMSEKGGEREGGVRSVTLKLWSQLKHIYIVPQ